MSTISYRQVALRGVVVAVDRYADGTWQASVPIPAGGAPPSDDYLRYLAETTDGAVVSPPDPPPLVYRDGITIDQRLRTTNATPAELWRATLAQRTGYRATLTLIAVDAGNGAVRTIEARVTAKRLTGNALLVGTPVVISDQQDSGTSSWAITAAVSGADFVVTVTGAAGRNIDWQLAGDVVSFMPGGR